MGSDPAPLCLAPGCFHHVCSARVPALPAPASVQVDLPLSSTDEGLTLSYRQEHTCLLLHSLNDLCVKIRG